MVLFIAAKKIKTTKKCAGFEVDINGAADGQWFIDKKDILQLITGSVNDSPKNITTGSFDLQALEEKLEKNVWVKSAELYFDNNQVLQVKISERVPVARIFTSTGKSFYIDSSLKRLPLSDKMSVRLPVFTNFPSDKSKFKKGDSVLMRDVSNISRYISRDNFWMAQIAQVDLTASRQFELIPTIGNHVIEFGDGKEIEKKFRRLLIFYKRVLSKTGMETYSRINVQYDKQVIGVRKRHTSKNDSLIAVKQIHHLIASIQKRDSIITDTLSATAKAQPATALNSTREKPEGSRIILQQPQVDATKKEGKSAQNSSMKNRPSETPVKM